MDMEERYRLILSTIFNAIGCRVEVEKMIATGRIDMVLASGKNVVSWHDTIVSRHNTVISWHDTTVSRHATEPYITSLTLVSRL